jgi:isoleucyl-tRNA synthetase
MAFDKVDTQVDFPAQEQAVLRFWDEVGAFAKRVAANRGKPPWSFLDGPITANNPMGVHHAWGRTYKDAYQRYFAMTGHDLRYQNGFDCQGLWVEVEVEKELGLRSKRDIENLVPGDRFASIDRFVNLCKQRVDRFARRQTDQSIRLGYWMNWDRDGDWDLPPDERKSYFTMSEENNYTIWNFLKKCHGRGLVYRGYDAMPWCPRCAVGLSQMEMHEGYQFVAHRAVFVRFPLRGRPGENLLVWTTTPWTLTSNVAAAVNPELTYLKVRHKDEAYYLAKGAFTAHRREEEFKRKEWVPGVPKLKTLEQIFKEKGGYTVEGELSGREMIGWTYDGPFDELQAQQNRGGWPPELVDRMSIRLAKGGHVELKLPGAAVPLDLTLDQLHAVAEHEREISAFAEAHRNRNHRDEAQVPGSSVAEHAVVGWDQVGATEGTGIVHIAPGCGKEDFELALEVGRGPDLPLPAVAPLDETGVYLPGFGELTGKSAVNQATTDWILNNLKLKGLLLDAEKYPHSYPHCWRCKTELLFRLVDEWFIDMGWRDEIMRVTEQVTFLPESIGGKARELDWLRNMGDWMISKKRFWGLALPIWVCERCSHFEVIGGREELKRRAVAGWHEFDGHSPHRPWIDLVKVRCEKCGGEAARIPDVGNPWLDAGIVPYSTMGYNRDREREWKRWFPADFITESFPGQFRNWFYAILAMSTMMEDRPPTKVILGHGLVRDEKGEEMHKSKGNAIPFEGAADDGYFLVVRTLKPGESSQAALKSKLPDGALGLEIGEVEQEGKKVAALLARYPPMGSDVLRWLYCRNNPALNINFGPHPANDVRARFILKLWNTYAFFCNYARLDAFDPARPRVPYDHKEFSPMDRWILAGLLELIQVAKRAFEGCNVQAFCLEAERFVDDKLSNWYVRRERRRFWKEEKKGHKWAAYQTLYTVLVTLSRLFAPVIPFLSEVMFRNLRRAGDHESVHLCDFPTREELINSLLKDVKVPSKDLEALLLADMNARSEHMGAWLRVCSLGSAARNLVKIKVRQPLGTMLVQPRDDAEDRALVEKYASPMCPSGEWYVPLIRDELNIRTVRKVPKGTLRAKVRLNMQRAGQRFGAKVNAVAVAVNQENPGHLLERLQVQGVNIEFPLADGIVHLEPADVIFEFDPGDPAHPGWVGVVDRGTIVAIDPSITRELRLEGLAREVVRYVQNARKNAGLEMEDRILLFLHTDSVELAEAIRTHAGEPADKGEPWLGIKAETLAEGPIDQPLGEGAHRTDVTIDGHPLTIELRKVEGR